MIKNQEEPDFVDTQRGLNDNTDIDIDSVEIAPPFHSHSAVEPLTDLDEVDAKKLAEHIVNHEWQNMPEETRFTMFKQVMDSTYHAWSMEDLVEHGLFIGAIHHTATNIPESDKSGTATKMIKEYHDWAEQQEEDTTSKMEDGDELVEVETRQGKKMLRKSQMRKPKSSIGRMSGLGCCGRTKKQ